MGNFCECPEGNYHDDDMLLDNGKNSNYSKKINYFEGGDEMKGLITKQGNRGRVSKPNKNAGLSVDNRISMSIYTGNILEEEYQEVYEEKEEYDALEKEVEYHSFCNKVNYNNEENQNNVISGFTDYLHDKEKSLKKENNNYNSYSNLKLSSIGLGINTKKVEEESNFNTSRISRNSSISK